MHPDKRDEAPDRHRRRGDPANDGIGVAAFYEAASKLPGDIQTKIDAAVAGMKDGSVVTCPPAPDCGKTPAPPIGTAN